VIEPSSSEQASVVFMGRRSFRMEIGTLAGATGSNEMAIPISASEVPTERIFGLDRARLFQTASTLATSPRSAFTASKGLLIGLCLAAFTFGILLTSTVDRSRPVGAQPMAAQPVAAQPVAAQPVARVQQPPPAPPPVAPMVAPSVEPIVVAVAPPAPELEAPAPRHAIARSPRDARVRTRTKRPTPTTEAAAPETTPDVPAPPKKWVDPFAD
jgi:hypothetical protein